MISIKIESEPTHESTEGTHEPVESSSNSVFSIKPSFSSISRVVAELSPGTRAFIKIKGSQPKFDSSFVGYKNNQFIILTIPSHCSIQPKNVFPLLYNGNDVTLYIMINGVLNALKCHVIRFTMDPYPLLFVSFPIDCATVNLRHSSRIRCLFRAALTLDEQNVSGMITDLSLGGCGFVCLRNHLPQHIATDMTVILDCRQLSPDDYHPITARVRSSVPASNSVRIGMLFECCPESTLQQLQKFISEASSLGQCC